MEMGLGSSTVFIAGASRGIGLAIAQGFLSEGANVVVTGRDSESLDLAEKSLCEQFNRDNLLFIQGDMGESETIDRALEQTLGRFGSLQTVVPNIGSGRGTMGCDLSPDDWSKMFEINLFASVNLVSKALALLDQDRGAVVFISSIAGAEALEAPIPYCAAKAALLSAMKNFSRQVGNSVRVNAVAPGNVYFKGGTWDRLLTEKKDYFEEYIRTKVPMQRLASPKEIADVVVYLASERASFVNGVCLAVDGGQTRSY